MSESATFVQPSSPTAGLQNYDLEPRAKELYPAPQPAKRLRTRHAAWRKRFISRGMKKEISKMATPSVQEMVGMLRKSVGQIISAAPDNSDELLNKSFDEFSAALTESVAGQLAKAAPPVEEPLFKGLGTVGRVANLVGSLASQIATIKQGYDNWQMRDGVPPPDADPASPELVEHLEDLLMHAELLMRVSVNEHCDPLDEGDDGGGAPIYMIPVDGGQLAVKCELPEDLAKFATDPALIDQMLIDQGVTLLGIAGVNVQALNKMLDAGDLAKFADPASPDAGSAPPSGLNASDAASVAGAAMPDDGQPQSPLEVLMRLLALALVQADYMQQMVEGTGGPSDPTGENPPDAGGANASAPNPDVTSTEANEKGAKIEGLAKLAAGTDEHLTKILQEAGLDPEALKKMADTNIALAAKVAEYEDLVPKLLAKAEPPKATLISSGTIVKGAEDPLAPPILMPDPEKLQKMEPTSRAYAVLKGVHAAGGKPSRGVD